MNKELVITILFWSIPLTTPAFAETSKIPVSDQHCGMGSFEAYPILKVIGELKPGVKVKLVADLEDPTKNRIQPESVSVCSVASQGSTQAERGWLQLDFTVEQARRVRFMRELKGFKGFLVEVDNAG